MLIRKVTAASMLPVAGLAALVVLGQPSSSPEPDGASPAQAATTQDSAVQVLAADIQYGKHWGD
jgi:hypothetical protein